MSQLPLCEDATQYASNQDGPQDNYDAISKPKKSTVVDILSLEDGLSSLRSSRSSQQDFRKSSRSNIDLHKPLNLKESSMDLLSAQQTVRQPSVEHLDIEDEVTKYLEEERNVLDMQSHLEHVHRLERPAE